jgi:hypothetical protein
MPKKKEVPIYLRPGYTGTYQGEAKSSDGTSISRQKAPQKEYRYGRGGRQTTTDKSVADRGRFMPYTYAQSGHSGSMKIQTAQKKKEQEAYEKAFSKLRGKR